MLSQKTKYALKALVSLARDRDRRAVVAGTLATQERIPRQFLELILLELKHHGLLRSRRGRGGGYALNRPADEISIGQVIRLLDGPLALVGCASQTAYVPCPECADVQTCNIRAVFKEVRDQTARILDGISLADLSLRPQSLEMVPSTHAAVVSSGARR
jgi:Rrf2 family protein